MKLNLATLFSRPRSPHPANTTGRRSHSLEVLEARIAPATLVSSIVRAGGAAPDTSAGSVTYTVTFSEAVTGVDATDFIVHTEGNAHAGAQVKVALVTPASPTVYTVTATGLHGQGDVRLDLVDNDSIIGTTSGVLGGAGVSNGSFQGATYHLLQTFPKVTSITPNGGSVTSATSVSWTVNLSAPVTGVDASDFSLVKTGVNADAALTVSGSGATYTVTATGVSGAGTLALKLNDDGTIKDANGNPLQAATPVSFVAKAPPATGSSPRTVAVGDLNGDGKLDLATANAGASNSVSVLLGNGDGTFQTQTTVPTANNPRFVVIADVNGDGKPDLITANGGSSNVSVLLGNGSGGFTAQASPSVGSSPVYVAVADLNGDGKPDLVTANINSNNVSVLLGNGNGTFGGQTTFSTGTNPNSLTVADVNGDGRPDLLTTNSGTNNVSLLLGDGAGGFTAQTPLTAGAVPTSVAVADLNGDGRADLAVASINTSQVTVLLANPSGGFTAQAPVAVGITPYTVAVGDVDGDGKPDLLTSNFTSDTVSVLVGNGTGGFTAQAAVSAGAAPSFAALSDLNGDGRTDLVTANFTDGNVTPLLNNGAGTFTSGAVNVTPPPVVTSITHAGSGTTTGPSGGWTVVFSTNVNGVDASDFAAVTSGGAKMGVISVTGSGSAYTVQVDGLQGSGDVQLKLIDNDSITNALAPLGGAGVANGSFQGDAVHVLQTAPKISSITANGAATTGASSVSWTVTLSAPVTGVDATDFSLVADAAVSADPTVTVSGSGASYTVTATGVSGAGALALKLVDNRSIKDANGNSLQVTPSFAAQPATVIGTNPYSVAVADLNGDGRPDFVAANKGSNNVSVMLGNGSGGFIPRPSVAVGVRPTAVAVADVNGDGKPDLVVTNRSDNNLSILLGNGSGGFSAQPRVTTGAAPFAVAVGDLNLDGKPDLVVTNVTAATLSVLLGNGNGGFTAQAAVAIGSSSFSVALGDLNGDGKLDAVTTDFSGGVNVLIGNGNGGFTPQIFLATQNGTDAVTLADINGDGTLDILAANQYSNNVSVLVGNGSGGFTALAAVDVGDAPFAVAVGDLDGDGKLDFVTANNGADSLSVRLGNGSGGFTAQSTPLTGVAPTAVALGDLNGDGRLDLVSANLISNNLSILLGAGSGAFTGEAFTIQPPTVTIAVTPVSIAENSGTDLTYTFIRTDDTSAALTVKFAASGTATFQASGQDYTLPDAATFDAGSGTGTVVFAPGSATAVLHLHVTGDTNVEAAESATISLAPGSGYTVGAGTSATGTITNDDGPPVISIADASVLEGNAGSTSLNFTVTLSAASIQPISVFYSTTDGTAIAPGDYAAQHSVLLTFAPGETSQQISVPVFADTLYEGGADETLLVHLSAPDAATLGNSLAVGTILHDEAAPAVSAILDAKHPFTFLDANHDKVTVKLAGHGTGTVILNGGVAGGADISEINLHGTDLASALSVSVIKDPMLGDGLVAIGEVTADSSLGSFTAKSSKLTVGGFQAAGAVKTIATGNLLHGEIVTLGNAADALALTVGKLAVGTVVRTGETISALTATSMEPATVQAPAITAISVTAGPLAADLTTAGAIGKITVKGGDLTGHLTAASFGAVSITGGSFSGMLTSAAPAASLGKTAALTSLSITTGNLSGNVNLLGASGAITVKTGSLSGYLTAASFGAVSVTGGDFSGSLISLTPRATLGTTKALTSLTVTDGDLTGNIRLLGASGAITVNSKPALNRGNLNGASIVASAIASLTVGRDFISSIVLAGADLGGDYAFGSDPTQSADTFAAGTIGAVKIGRNVSGAGSIIGAGFSNVDGILKSVDDAIIGGVASVIASLTVTGTAAPESYFAAGLFKAPPKIAGAVVTTAGDGRFKVG